MKELKWVDYAKPTGKKEETRPQNLDFDGQIETQSVTFGNDVKSSEPFKNKGIFLTLTLSDAKKIEGEGGIVGNYIS